MSKHNHQRLILPNWLGNMIVIFNDVLLTFPFTFCLSFLKNEVDEIEEYNPWGRPGEGAPIRSHSGKVVADFKKMAQV